MKKIFTLLLFIQANNFIYSQPLCDFKGKDSLYVDIDENTVYVWDIAACGYCNSSFAMSVSMSADTIYIIQTDTVKDVALCGCIFNIRTSIVGLSGGTHWIVLYRDWPKNNIHQFIRAIQFTHTPTISESLQWNGYQSGCIVDAVEVEKHHGAEEYVLFRNYPNPFNPTTTLRFTLPRGISTKVMSLNIYNILGQVVKTFEISNLSDNTSHELLWDGRSNDGAKVSSGVYFAVLTATQQRHGVKLMLLK